jgi:hypothetical protein
LARAEPICGNGISRNFTDPGATSVVRSADRMVSVPTLSRVFTATVLPASARGLATRFGSATMPSTLGLAWYPSAMTWNLPCPPAWALNSDT